MDGQNVNLGGVTVTEKGETIGGFSVPFIILNMIGSGLSWFVAIAWSNVFQSALDEYKKREDTGTKKISPVWMNFMMALGATIFTVAIIYLLVTTYSKLSKQKLI